MYNILIDGSVFDEFSISNMSSALQLHCIRTPCCFLDSTQKPGPGAHYPERVHINKKSPPRFSMGTRHSDYTTPLIVEVTE